MPLKFLSDAKSIKKYSEDRSPYRIKPQAAVVPRIEKDVQDIVRYALEKSLPITARGAGSNLSGSAVGSGLIIDFSRMRAIKKISGSTVRVEPGVIHGDLNKKLAARGLVLPFSPSSAAFCTLGGNLGTKAAGLRSVKYGGMDSFVRSARFVDARGRVIDTSKGVPDDLAEKILGLRGKLLQDDASMTTLKKRERLKSSSGYNISALYRYNNAGDIITHLLAGSVGTLGLVTEIELALVKKPKKTMLCVAYFSSLKESGGAVLKIKNIGPSALEIMDSFSLQILKKSKFNIPKDAEAALLIEFDDNLAASEKRLREVLAGYSTQFTIEKDEKKKKKIWQIRSDLLTIVERQHNVIAFVEDIGVPPEHIADFIRDIEEIFTSNGTQVVIFGHAGEGNLHIRPVIKPGSWRNDVKNLADECYAAAFKYGGTVTAEHGAGRNKSPYIMKEWGPRIYGYFREIKDLFDPNNILNPGVMFSGDDITKNMKY